MHSDCYFSLGYVCLMDVRMYDRMLMKSNNDKMSL